MKVNILKNIQKTLMLRLLIYFILIVAVTLSASSFFTYNFFSSSFKNEITDFNHRILDQLSILSDEFLLKNFNNMALGLIMDTSDSSDFSGLFSFPMQDRTITLMNINQKLQKLVSSNSDLVDSIIVHSKENNVIVTSDFVQFMDTGALKASPEFKFISDFYNSGQSLVWLKPRRATMYSDFDRSEGDIITLLSTYPLSAKGKDVKGCVAVNIKENALSSYLMKFNAQKFGQLMIIDKSGAVISDSDSSHLYRDMSGEAFVKDIVSGRYGEDFSTVYENHRCEVSYMPSKYSDWYYVSIVPTELFYQRNFSIKQKIFLISVLILIAAFLLSNVISLRVYLPFKRIIDKYTQLSGGKSQQSTPIADYKLLDNMFGDMSDRINSLQDSLNRNQAMIRRNFLTELLNNRIAGQEEFSRLYRLSGLDFPRNFYCVAVFSFEARNAGADKRSQVQLVKYLFADYIERTSFDDFSCFDVDTDSKTISLIINTDLCEADRAERFVNQISRFCQEHFGYLPHAALGRYVDEPLDVNKSYIDARTCLKYKFILPGESLFRYDRFVMGDAPSGAALEFADKLDRQLKTENYDKVHSLMDMFLNTVLENRVNYRDVRKEISDFMSVYRQYLAEMNVSPGDVGDDTLIARLTTPADIHEFVQSFLQAVRQTFGHLASRKLNKNQELVKLVQQYVLNNLHRDLSLNSAADHVHVSPNYLSKLFKDETGMNYIEFVVQKKLDKAKELLSKSSVSIEEITRQIGYSHITYFSRKFKEQTGKTPAEYRNSQMRLSPPAEESQQHQEEVYEVQVQPEGAHNGHLPA